MTLISYKDSSSLVRRVSAFKCSCTHNSNAELFSFEKASLISSSLIGRPLSRSASKRIAEAGLLAAIPFDLVRGSGCAILKYVHSLQSATPLVTSSMAKAEIRNEHITTRRRNKALLTAANAPIVEIVFCYAESRRVTSDLKLRGI